MSGDRDARSTRADTTDDLHTWSAKALRGEVRRLRRMLSDQLRSTSDGLEVESVVNRDARPFVHLRWGDELTQFTPDEARTFAAGITDSAAAAEFDASFVLALRDNQGAPFDDDTIWGLLHVIRMQRTGEINVSLRRATATRRPPPPPPRKRR